MAREWTAAHEDRMRAILASMQRECTPDLPVAPEAVPSLPFAEKARLLFPHFIDKDTADAPFHPELDGHADLPGMPVCDCGFRGSAKSARIMVCRTTLDICERRFRSLAFGAKTEDAAAEKADIVRNELRRNARLRLVYGDDLEPQFGNDKETDWTANGCRLIALGVGQSLRGLLTATGVRLECFRGDDLDDLRTNQSRKLQDKLWDWLWNSIYPGFVDPARTARMQVLCNMYNRTCMANRWAEKANQLDEQGRPVCAYAAYPALTPEGESAWPERYSTAALRRVRVTMGHTRWLTEYMCKPAREDAVFRPEWFHSYSVASLPDFAGVA